jgi:hypothetical protein
MLPIHNNNPPFQINALTLPQCFFNATEPKSPYAHCFCYPKDEALHKIWEDGKIPLNKLENLLLASRSLLNREKLPELEPMKRTISKLPQPLSVHLKNGETINLEKGSFNGDVSKAMNYLQDFSSHAKMEIYSYGHGYGNLIINGQKHRITPYGIDIEMMLRLCGGKDAKDFPSS